MHVAIDVVTAPVSGLRVVDLATVKQHCRIDISDDDALLDQYQLAAIDHIERETGGKVLEQIVRVTMDAFDPYRALLLPTSPVRTIENVKYIDTAGALQTLASTEYVAVMGQVVTRLEPVTTWPSADKRIGAVRIECGVGWVAAAMPATIKQAVLLLVGHWYLNREAAGTVASEIALAFESLVSRHCVNWAT